MSKIEPHRTHFCSHYQFLSSSPNGCAASLRTKSSTPVLSPSSIEKHLVFALRHPNCNLVQLVFVTNQPEHEAAAKVIMDMLHILRALLALLQGQKVYYPLKRLPVYLFRLVGTMLL
ncbi:hypothetical protein BASA81_008281 [Batrachochytrium salamandrivorans]|nr:hypothetical protein BASA81_008281 [Batrachochytrium salamandrivorans]